jgi:hypothetical protein
MDSVAACVCVKLKAISAILAKVKKGLELK